MSKSLCCQSELTIECASYADDSLLSVSHPDPFMTVACLNSILNVVSDWAATWGMRFNARKTVAMCIQRNHSARRPHGISFLGVDVPFSQKHCHLGVTLSDDMKFTDHIRSICARVNKELYVLRILSYHIRDNPLLLLKLFKAFILPHLEYGAVVFAGIGKVLTTSLERLQRKAIRLILHIPPRDDIPLNTYELLRLDTLSFRRNFSLACVTYKLCHGLCPRAMEDYAPVRHLTNYVMRSPRYILNPVHCPTGVHSELFRRSPLSLCVSLMNIMPEDCITFCDTLCAF